LDNLAMNTARRHQFQPGNILLSVIKYAGNSFEVTDAKSPLMLFL